MMNEEDKGSVVEVLKRVKWFVEAIYKGEEEVAKLDYVNLMVSVVLRVLQDKEV